MKKQTITLQAAHLQRFLLKAEGLVVSIKPTSNDPHKVEVIVDASPQQLYEVGYQMGLPDTSYR